MLTYQPDIKSRKVSKASLQQIVAKIRQDGALKNQTAWVRQASNPDELRKRKTTLPGVTFAGLFNGRRTAAHLLEYSHAAAFDFDDLGDRLPSVREKIVSLPCCLLVYVSPSGDGLKAVLLLPENAKPSTHTKYVQEMGRKLRALGYGGDRGGNTEGDLARLAFLCHDPDAYLNLDAVPAKLTLPPDDSHKPPAPDLPPNDTERLRKALSRIQGMAETYEDWVKVGMALFRWDHEWGFKLWVEWSHGVDAYKVTPLTVYRQKWEKAFSDDQRPGHDKITVNSIFYWADNAREGEEMTFINIEHTLDQLLQPVSDEEVAKVELIKDEFFCRSTGLLFAGGTGLGKSILLLQLTMSFAIGRHCLGLRPRKPLKILTIQNENPEIDLRRFVRSVCDNLGLRGDEEACLHSNWAMHTVKGISGQSFIDQAIKPKLDKTPYDILCIDPNFAYAGGDISDPVVAYNWVRRGLDVLATDYNLGVMVVHHPPRNRASSKSEHESEYAGYGSVEFANWPRATLELRKHTPGVYSFIAGKRQNRIGWEDGDELTDRIYLERAESGFYWHQCDKPELEEHKRGPKTDIDNALILQVLKEGPGKPAGIHNKLDELFQKAHNRRCPLDVEAVRGRLRRMVEKGYIEKDEKGHYGTK